MTLQEQVWLTLAVTILETRPNINPEDAGECATAMIKQCKEVFKND